MMSGACCIVLVALFAMAAGQNTYPHTMALNSNYQLSWKVLNTTHIQFKTEVQGARWFGFGISTNGAMFPADVVLGFLSPTDNSIVFNDMHTTEHVRPTLDASQDWTMLKGTSTNDNLEFEFVRALDTKDADDVAIVPGKTHVIWSYSYNLTALATPYHGMNRGSVDIGLVLNDDIIG